MGMKKYSEKMAVPEFTNGRNGRLTILVSSYIKKLDSRLWSVLCSEVKG